MKPGYDNATCTHCGQPIYWADHEQSWDHDRPFKLRADGTNDNGYYCDPPIVDTDPTHLDGAGVRRNLAARPLEGSIVSVPLPGGGFSKRLHA